LIDIATDIDLSDILHLKLCCLCPAVLCVVPCGFTTIERIEVWPVKPEGERKVAVAEW